MLNIEKLKNIYISVILDRAKRELKTADENNEKKDEDSG